MKSFLIFRLQYRGEKKNQKNKIVKQKQQFLNNKIYLFKKVAASYGG